jgi:hypothetical protein
MQSEGAVLKKFPSERAFRSASEPGWFSATDKFGPLTELRLPVSAGPFVPKLSAR